MIVWAAIAAGAAALATTAVAAPLFGRLAKAAGMLDIPAAHKRHESATPLLGGSAIFLGVLLPSVAAVVLAKAWASGSPAWLPEELAVHLAGAAEKMPMAMGILIGAAALHVLGLIDDRNGLGAWPKLAVQVAVAAFVVVVLEVRVLALAGPAVSIPLSVLWIVAITNAFNFLDNMDGLCAGVAAICCAALLAASAQTGQLFVSAWLCLLLGALLGFLPYSFPPARIFMGDAGSLVIGYLLGVISCLTTYVRPSVVSLPAGVLMPVVLMAVPLYDMGSVVALRLWSGQNPFVGDRRHFSHRLVQRGMSMRTAVLTVYLCTAGTAIAASLLPHTDSRGAWLIGGQVLMILLIIALLEWSGRGNSSQDEAKGGP